MTTIPKPCILSQIPSPKSKYSFHVVYVEYIKALLRRVASCRHQLIVQEVDLKTPIQYLKACMHQW